MVIICHFFEARSTRKFAQNRFDGYACSCDNGTAVNYLWIDCYAWKDFFGHPVVPRNLRPFFNTELALRVN